MKDEDIGKHIARYEPIQCPARKRARKTEAKNDDEDTKEEGEAEEKALELQTSDEQTQRPIMRARREDDDEEEAASQEEDQSGVLVGDSSNREPQEFSEKGEYILSGLLSTSESGEAATESGEMEETPAAEGTTEEPSRSTEAATDTPPLTEAVFSTANMNVGGKEDPMRVDSGTYPEYPPIPGMPPQPMHPMRQEDSYPPSMGTPMPYHWQGLPYGPPPPMGIPPMAHSFPPSQHYGQSQRFPPPPHYCANPTMMAQPPYQGLPAPMPGPATHSEPTVPNEEATTQQPGMSSEPTAEPTGQLGKDEDKEGEKQTEQKKKENARLLWREKRNDLIKQLIELQDERDEIELEGVRVPREEKGIVEPGSKERPDDAPTPNAPPQATTTTTPAGQPTTPIPGVSPATPPGWGGEGPPLNGARSYPEYPPPPAGTQQPVTYPQWHGSPYRGGPPPPMGYPFMAPHPFYPAGYHQYPPQYRPHYYPNPAMQQSAYPQRGMPSSHPLETTKDGAEQPPYQPPPPTTTGSASEEESAAPPKESEEENQKLPASLNPYEEEEGGEAAQDEGDAGLRMKMYVKPRLPTRQEILDRRARKNARSRARAAKTRERIASIKSKSVDERTGEEMELLERFESRRQRKNDRSRERAVEKNTEIDRILKKPERKRTKLEKQFLEMALMAKQRKNEGDRMRRQKIKHLIKERDEMDGVARARMEAPTSGIQPGAAGPRFGADTAPHYSYGVPMRYNNFPFPSRADAGINTRESNDAAADEHAHMEM